MFTKITSAVSLDCVVGATKLLGETITSVGYDLGDSEHNYYNGSEAVYQVKVKGSKDKGEDNIISSDDLIAFQIKHIYWDYVVLGKMFLWAKRQPNNEDWLLDRLELEVHSQPNRRYIIKKPQQQISTDNWWKFLILHKTEFYRIIGEIAESESGS